jgi:murein DD-endopeptidase MepM/ murein hydrolase activator NlpD
MAETGPDGALPDATSADPSSDSNSGGSISVYVVKDGDSLSGIAAKFGVTMNTILWANDIKDPKTIHTGTSLIILPVSGIEHTVAKGETLNGIAAKYGADADDIASFNGLGADATVTTGQKLIIPGGELSSSASVSKPSSSTSSKPSTSSTKSSSTSSTKIKTGGSLADVQANPYRGGSGAPLDGYFGNPLPGAIVTQGIHGWNGVDLGAPAGTPIYAAAAGTVIVSKVGGYNGGYGNYVVIDHGNGTQTLYAHFSSIVVSVGQTVSKGEKLGGVGRTGDATGNHLHFEVRGARNPFADCALMQACTPE